MRRIGSVRRKAPVAKLRFAAPFVVITAPLLTDCTHRECSKIVEGDACSGSDRCVIDGQDNACGLNGYSCRGGKWRADVTYCNPPPQNPPSPERAPSVPPSAEGSSPVEQSVPDGVRVSE